MRPPTACSQRDHLEMVAEPRVAPFDGRHYLLALFREIDQPGRGPVDGQPSAGEIALGGFHDGRRDIDLALQAWRPTRPFMPIETASDWATSWARTRIGEAAGGIPGASDRHVCVVGAGVDPATPRFSGACSTN